ncbi:MAG: carboxypeptidase-like regulatory domain-containing protein [Paludibacter sp.]|nr:carboxypeptidase-like regulatory domain-containing protein [Paludibacter sp.]
MLFCLNDFLNGQNSVKGLVLNLENQNPVSDATVYINGTTRGTSTDSNGLFELKDVSYPCQLMVRQVGYEMQVLNLDNPIKDKLAIFLK